MHECQNLICFIIVWKKGPRTAALYKLLPATSGYIRGYDTNLNPQTLVGYAAGAGRAGHSNIVGKLKWENHLFNFYI